MTELLEIQAIFSISSERCKEVPGAPTAFLIDLDFDSLTTPSYSEQAEPRVTGRGEGLASALAFIKLNHDTEFRAVASALQSIVPSVRRIHFRREKSVRSEPEVVTFGNDRVTRNVERVYWADALLFDTDGATNVPATQMSEGTLLTLGLLAVVMGKSSPDVVLIDDLERGIHPKAQRQIVQLLRKVLEQHPNLQVVATTHSPYLLDEVKPEEVRLTSLQPDGSVACAKLTEHPKFAKWKDEMSPGEFWSMIGEKWVSERPPAESR